MLFLTTVALHRHHMLPHLVSYGLLSTNLYVIMGFCSSVEDSKAQRVHVSFLRLHSQNLNQGPGLWVDRLGCSD